MSLVSCRSARPRHHFILNARTAGGEEEWPGRAGLEVPTGARRSRDAPVPRRRAHTEHR
jgi:hypothetical protein